MEACTSRISQMPQEQCSSTFRLKPGILTYASKKLIFVLYGDFVDKINLVSLTRGLLKRGASKRFK